MNAERHPVGEAHAPPALGGKLDRVQSTNDAQGPLVSVADGSQEADAHHDVIAPVGSNGNRDQEEADPQMALVAASNGSAGDHHDAAAHGGSVSGAATVFLQFAAATLSDVERLRIATGNRLDAWEREGLPDGPERQRFGLLLETLEGLEHQATLELKRALRRHPLGEWVKHTVGVGEKQGARLIAAIGDPAYNHAEGRRRRGPAELWAYCGFKPGQKRQKGVRANWNAEAKMRAFLIAESCIKQVGTDDAIDESRSNEGARRRSPYRDVYDRAKANWADRETTDLHKHNHALRVVAKAVLKDLWRAGREATATAMPTNAPPLGAAEETARGGGQPPCGAHNPHASADVPAPEMS